MPTFYPTQNGTYTFAFNAVDTSTTVNDIWVLPPLTDSFWRPATGTLYGDGYDLNQAVWTTWTSTTSGVYRQPDTGYNRRAVDSHEFNLAAEPTVEQQRRNALVRRHSAVSALRQRVANRKAKALLFEHLTQQQREDYERLQRFELVLPNGHHYRLRRGLAGNIDRIEGDRIVERLCVHVPHGIPHDDNVLTQKLSLEVDEAEVRRLANIERLFRAA